MPQADERALRDRQVMLLVIACLSALYALTFSGQYRSIDEYAMYARTESWALGLGPETPQLAFSARHHPVGALEPGQPLLAVPFYLLSKAMPGASTTIAVMLLSVVATAATGGVLYRLARELGCGERSAALTALACSVGTTAWPYARSFFREPLLGLLWSVAALDCLRWQRTGAWTHALACGIAAAAGVAVKIASVTALPVFALALLWDPGSRRLRLSRRTLWWGVAGGALALGAAALLWRLRYGSALPLANYTWGYPWGRALQVAYGLILSPVKGILVFSPVLLAALPGWPRMARRHGATLALVLGLTAALLYTYGNHPQWHGGSVVWGPRFVVPLLPLLMLPMAVALSQGGWWTRLWCALWCAVSLPVQAAAGTVSWSDAVWQLVPAYQNETLVGLDGIPWWSWRLLPRSPALVQLQNWAPRQLDILWLRTLSDGTLARDALLGGALIVAAAVAGGALGVLLFRPPRRAGIRQALTACALIAALAGGGLILARSGRNCGEYAGLGRAEAAALAAAVSAPAGAEHALLYVGNDFFTYHWLGLVKGRVLVHWQSPHDEAAIAATARAAAESGADRIWLVVDRVHAQSDVDPNAARHALAAEAYELEGRWIGGFEVLAYAPQADMAPLETAASWENGLRLLGAATGQDARPGEALRVDLQFVTDRPLEDLSLYVHLVPEQGAVLAARDGAPHYGGALTPSWAPGEEVLERRAVVIPAGAPAGAYALRIGWLNAAGQRVRTSDGQEEADLGTVLLPAP